MSRRRPPLCDEYHTSSGGAGSKRVQESRVERPLVAAAGRARDRPNQARRPERERGEEDGEADERAAGEHLEDALGVAPGVGRGPLTVAAAARGGLVGLDGHGDRREARPLAQGTHAGPRGGDVRRGDLQAGVQRRRLVRGLGLGQQAQEGLALGERVDEAVVRRDHGAGHVHAALRARLDVGDAGEAAQEGLQPGRRDSQVEAGAGLPPSPDETSEEATIPPASSVDADDASSATVLDLVRGRREGHRGGALDAAGAHAWEQGAVVEWRPTAARERRSPAPPDAVAGGAGATGPGVL